MLGGCSKSMAASAEEIISNVLTQEDELIDYYGKYEIKMYMDEQLTENMTVKEFAKKDGKRKAIVTDHNRGDKKIISVNDGKQIIIYEEGNDVAYTINIENEELPSSMTQKEQFITMLEGIKETHSYEVSGEEEIIDRKTYHLTLTAKEKNTWLGNMELWIDQKSWIILKGIIESEDQRVELIYKEIDFSPNFSKEDFTLQLPDSVEVKKLENETELNTGTIEEAEQALGQSFLLFKEEKVHLEKIEWETFGGELNRTEATLYYQMDGVPALTLSVFPAPKEEDLKINGDISVRDQKGEYEKIINALMWDESGLRYTVIIEHPDLTLEDILELTEKMDYTS